MKKFVIYAKQVKEPVGFVAADKDGALALFLAEWPQLQIRKIRAYSFEKDAQVTIWNIGF